MHLVLTLLSTIIAIIAGKTLALLLPFRFRPIHEEGLNLILPYGMKLTTLEGWSAFPSDHAVMFYALSTGMFYVSKKAGILATVYTTLFIALPRVYLGLHYPTDIIGGAFVGMVIALLCHSNYLLEKVSRPVIHYSSIKPEFFYPLLFIVTSQLADQFDECRAILSLIYSVFRALLS